LDENGLNDNRDGDAGDGKMSITQMYNKYITEEENKMNGAGNFGELQSLRIKDGGDDSACRVLVISHCS
jgi:hypothetical protein